MNGLDIFSFQRQRLAMKKALLALGIAGSAWVTSPTAAMAAEPATSFGGGAYVGFTFGGGEPGFAWGVEAFAHHFPDGDEELICFARRENRAFYGGTLQIGAVGIERPRIVAAFSGGSTLADDTIHASGEAGLVYRFGDGGGFGAHLGARAHAGVMSTFLRTGIGLDEYTIGGGLALPSTALFEGVRGCAVPGRPLRTDEGMADMPVARVASIDSPVVRAWTGRAQAEWASVPAFVALADQLVAAGAPQPLVQRAHRSAKDELEHAVLAGGLAAIHANATVTLDDPFTAQRPPATGLEARIRLAVESWLDGCLGEGAAAAVARAEGNHTPDPRVREVQYRIAHDEQRHAELAWDVLSWALRTGGAPVRDAIETVKHEVPEGFGQAAHEDGLMRYGCADAAATIAASGLDHSRARLAHLLA